MEESLQRELEGLSEDNSQILKDFAADARQTFSNLREEWQDGRISAVDAFDSLMNDVTPENRGYLFKFEKIEYSAPDESGSRRFVTPNGAGFLSKAGIADFTPPSNDEVLEDLLNFGIDENEEPISNQDFNEFKDELADAAAKETYAQLVESIKGDNNGMYIVPDSHRSSLNIPDISLARVDNYFQIQEGMYEFHIQQPYSGYHSFSGGIGEFIPFNEEIGERLGTDEDTYNLVVETEYLRRARGIIYDIGLTGGDALNASAVSVFIDRAAEAHARIDPEATVEHNRDYVYSNLSITPERIDSIQDRFTGERINAFLDGALPRECALQGLQEPLTVLFNLENEDRAYNRFNTEVAGSFRTLVDRLDVDITDQNRLEQLGVDTDRLKQFLNTAEFSELGAEWPLITNAANQWWLGPSQDCSEFENKPSVILN